MKQLVFVGLPASGKSTVGRRVARRLHVDFVDSDAHLEARIGMPIRRFFAESGEAAFRAVEAEVVMEICRPGTDATEWQNNPSKSASFQRVIATGGGIVLRPENRAALRSAGLVVYLHSTVEEIVRRTRHDQRRPLLQVADPEAAIRSLYDVRDPLYRETAHIVVESGASDVQDLVERVLDRLKRPADAA